MGIDNLLQQNMQSAGLAGGDRLARNAMFPQSQMDKTQYAVSSQLPTSAETIRSDYDEPSNAYTGLPTQPFAEGGITSIPRYADGGLFNAQAYLDANPDVAASGMDPWSHYQTFGINENRALSAPAPNPTQFNAQAYLAANPDVAASGMDPLYHYTMYGQNEGRQADFTYDADAAKYAEQLANANAQTELNKYQFSNTDDAPAKDIYDLKTSNPDLFYSKMAGSLSNQIFNSYIGNNYGSSSSAQNLLESIKTDNPTAYYNSKLGLLGKEQGWQHGQNTFGNAAGYQAEVNKIAPEALAAGLTADQINSLVGGGFSDASTQNQQRIASIPAGNKFWKDNLIGTAKVAAKAFGAYGIDTALTAAAEAAYMSADATNLASQGLSQAAIAQNLASSYGISETAALAAAGATGAGTAAGTAADAAALTSEIASNPTTQAMLDFANASPDPIQAMAEMQNMTPAELTTALGPGATEGLTASEIVSYANKVRQAYGLAKNVAGIAGIGNSGGATARASGQVPNSTASGSGGSAGSTASGSGGSAGSSQGIAAAASPMFNPTVASGLNIAPTTQADIPTFLSKLSDFKYDAPTEMAAGGMTHGGGISNLGSYSDGGRLLKGPGDGMSDHIPATIGAKQPARLAEGEFVIPADVVSHLGNGSTDAGAKQLYKMMNNIRRARTGNPKQGKQINPDKFTLKG